jgi:uncharacterized protein YjiS (DUF1127 family)
MTDQLCRIPDRMRIMALLQTDHRHAAYRLRPPRSPAGLAAPMFAHAGSDLLVPLRALLDGLRQWPIRRAMRRWRVAAERARQRRALVRLTDRELRDIGITRYEVDFVLRRGLRH